MHIVRSEWRPTRDPCVLGHEIIGRVPANLLKNNRKERKMTYTAMLLSLALLVSAGAAAGQVLAAEADKTSQTIFRAGSQGSSKGPAEFFTGNVRVDRLFPVNDTAHLAGAYVTFEPGARSAWHTHPTGQYLDRKSVVEGKSVGH